MEYLRKSIITDFYFYKTFLKEDFHDIECLKKYLKINIDKLHGGDYFFTITRISSNGSTSTSHNDFHTVTFYFYNETDLLLAKLSL